MKSFTKRTVLPEPRREVSGTNQRSLSGPRRDPQPSRQYQPLWSSTPNISVFQRSISQESGGFVPNEQRFPQTNDQSSSHGVRFTTTDDSIHEYPKLWPLNWWNLRSLTPVAQGVQDLASIFSFSPPETLKKIVGWKLNSCGITELPARSAIIGLFGRSRISNTL